MAVDHPNPVLTGHQMDHAGLVERLLGQLRHWLALHWLRTQVQQERKQLRDLPDSILRDIGIDRNDALRESERGFSDLPLNRAAQLTEDRGSDINWQAIEQHRLRQGAYYL